MNGDHGVYAPRPHAERDWHTSFRQINNFDIVAPYVGVDIKINFQGYRYVLTPEVGSPIGWGVWRPTQISTNPMRLTGHYIGAATKEDVREYMQKLPRAKVLLRRSGPNASHWYAVAASLGAAKVLGVPEPTTAYDFAYSPVLTSRHGEFRVYLPDYTAASDRYAWVRKDKLQDIILFEEITDSDTRHRAVRSTGVRRRVTALGNRIR